MPLRLVQQCCDDCSNEYPQDPCSPCQECAQLDCVTLDFWENGTVISSQIVDGECAYTVEWESGYISTHTEDELHESSNCCDEAKSLINNKKELYFEAWTNTAWTIDDPPNFVLQFTGMFTWVPYLCAYQDDQTFNNLLFFEETPTNNHIITSSFGQVYVPSMEYITASKTFVLEGYESFARMYPPGGYRFTIYQNADL